MKPASKVIDVNFGELEALLQRARQGPLGEEDYRKLEAAIHTLSHLIELIGEKETTISRLGALLIKPSTEKTRKVLEQAGLPTPPPSGSSPPPSGSDCGNQKKKPGHGRHGAEAYRGAQRIEVAHASLKPGDGCPECEKGKVYRQKDPALRIRVVGQAPLQATVYELERLRCNLCGVLFEAKAPEGVGEKKYDESAAAMIGLLKYGSGVPFYRLAGLEGNLGMPLPRATQWGIVRETSEVIRPAYEELIRQVAQGEVLYNDDTAMKILALARASPRSAEVDEEASDPRLRTGQFTSGIVSTQQGQRIALFFTGRRHAGENLAQVLARRGAGLTAPIQMCDALSRNLPKLPKPLETIVGNCLAHARRYFVDVVPNFPEPCRYVLEKPGQGLWLQRRSRSAGSIAGGTVALPPGAQPAGDGPTARLAPDPVRREKGRTELRLAHGDRLRPPPLGSVNPLPAPSRRAARFQHCGAGPEESHSPSEEQFVL